MEANEKIKFQRIENILGSIGVDVAGIREQVSRPPNKGRQIIELVAACVGVASIVSVIEQILQWIRSAV
ncbi:MAG: hypothetical protein LBM77_05125 [Spirochaetaceae bacterium]|jgi:hypothetical protein|nr:hypothetical protein [Spirochaetaceae bacterium]